MTTEQQKQIIRRAREAQQLGNTQAVRECRAQLNAANKSTANKRTS